MFKNISFASLKKGNIYIVKWIDTFVTHGWIDEDDMKKHCSDNKEWITTIGFYVGRMDGYEVFSAQNTKNPNMLNWSGMFAIPKGCIKSISSLS